MSAGLAITVDVDGEAGLPAGGIDYAHRLSARSERAYGVGRGLERVLGALAEFRVTATFYVPGVTAARHPDEIRSLRERGHEVGHHGHTHRSPHTLTAGEQRGEIEDGLAALAELGIAPRAYRAPAWELTDATLAVLADHNFDHDSSLMGDDRPYLVEAGNRRLVELPVHWTLDDAPYFAADPGSDNLRQVWLRELDLAAGEGRPITLTLHPDILGRPHRIDVLRRVLEQAGRHGVPTLTHAELAAATRSPRGDP
jgi:peptidoglycan-N-acetylglucosamine deacetylase